MHGKIEFSAHALLKVEILKAHGIDVSRELIEEIVRFPDRIEEGYKGRLVAQRRIDESHVVRVVYESNPDKALVVTVYPGRRSRYEKNKIQ